MKKGAVWAGLVCVLLAGFILWDLFAHRKAEPYRTSDYLMDAYVTQTVYDGDAKAAADAVRELIHTEEAHFSRYLETSDIGRINASAGEPVAVSPETASLLSECRAFAAHFPELNGFALTIGSLVDLWGFGTDAPHLPNEDEIAAAVGRIGDDALTVSNQISLPLSAGRLDLGGVAKGYAAGHALSVYREFGVTSAVLSLGGNIAVLGQHPNGAPFEIGLRDPSGAEQELAGQFRITADCVIATTGGYERYFEENGVRYHHVLDPKTGYPADSDLLSVTVVSQNGGLADYLSTALFVGGKQAVLSHLDGEDYAVLAIGTDKMIYLSDCLRDCFTPEKGFALAEVTP